MSIHFTLNSFPVTGTLKDQCGLPFACVVQPYATPAETPKQQPLAKAEDVSRCSDCYAYINAHCSFQLDGWICSLCGYFNEYNNLKNRRYARSSGRALLPEVQSNFVELQCLLEDEAKYEAGQEGLREVPIQPVYLAVVDLSCDDEFLELVKSALLAALEALPPAAVFGLVTFSDKVGLYDVQGRVPSVRKVALVEDDSGSPVVVDLQDALPLDALLAPVASCKEAIASALDMLQPESPSPTPLPHDDEDGGLLFPDGGRGFGGTLQAVLRYLGSSSALRQESTTSESQRGSAAGKDTGQAGSSGREPSSTAAWNAGFVGARMMVFLSGPPNHGRGSVLRLTAVPGSKGAEAQDLPPVVDVTFPDINPYSFPTQQPRKAASSMPNGHSEPLTYERDESARRFYEEAAVAAASLGVSVDVYVASPDSCGLDLIEPLAGSSGGALLLYPTLEQAALPQDVYRRLSSSYALSGLLRIRTSSEFRVARSFGQLYPDERYENLAHVVACDPSSSFAFDFEYTDATGFAGFSDNPPMLQMAFQYHTVVPVPQSPLNGPKDGSGQAVQSLWVLQRRLRLLTVPVKVAKQVRDVYEAVNPDAILTMLMHKIGRAADAQGLPEARELLEDWLVLFCSRYNSYASTQRAAAPLQVDVTFELVEALQHMARLVYALLRSPLLALQPQSHPDLRAAVHHLWASLPPSLLRCAIYPVLSSYTDPDTQAFSRHSLSRAALISSGAPIFLLDSFTSMIVYYAVGYPTTIPFPPPQQSLLRKAINSLRQHRRITPKLQMLRGGFDDVTGFLACLIEEPEADASGKVLVPGFVEYLEKIKGDTWAFMQSRG